MGLSSSIQGVEIVAHRGASYDAPENTLAAFRLAWEQGADAIESDFWLTRDGRVAVMHDATTQRTTGVDWKVSEHTLGELHALDAGAWKGDRWRGERVPTLEQVLALLRPGKTLRLEIKGGPQIIPAIQRAMGRAGTKPQQVIVISFHKDVIAAVKQQMPGIKAHWLYEFKKDKETGQWKGTPGELVESARAMRADGVSLKFNERVDRELVQRLRNAGLELHVWTIDDPVEAKRAVELGAVSITTDRPGYLRKELGL